MRIGFDCGGLNERGTTVSTYDYAYYAKAILGYEPMIFFDSNASVTPSVYERFRQQFELVSYSGNDGFQRQTEAHRIDVFYFIMAGQATRELSKSSKNVVHAVFQHFDPHGDIYAYISKWLSARMTGGLYPYVPHIVSMPDPAKDLRKALGIPKDAFVFGRHGGAGTFDLEFAQRAVLEALNRRKNLYFIFLNTDRFCEHERVVFLPAVTDPVKKSDFINACDAMLHARKRGESFGLAIAEFLFFDKPVLSWAGGVDRHHLQMLPEKTFAYKTYGDLLGLLTQLETKDGDGSWKRMVAQFSPIDVMKQFERVFIDSPPQDFSARPGVGTVLKGVAAKRVLKARYNLWRSGIRL